MLLKQANMPTAPTYTDVIELCDPGRLGPDIPCRDDTVSLFQQYRAPRSLGAIVIIYFFICHGTIAWAIDNPDAPDYVGEFLSRDQAYQSQIRNSADNTSSYRFVYTAYENFLDQELNAAYKMLMEHLDSDAKLQLKRSQRQWLKYRDAEFEFIVTNWTTGNFGSSSVISRGDYRTSVIKDRVLLLLHYLKNY